VEGNDASFKHLGIDPFAFLREALPALFAVGDRPCENLLANWLPDRWLFNKTRDHPTPDVPAG
jgi:hypothetical protein